MINKKRKLDQLYQTDNKTSYPSEYNSLIDEPQDTISNYTFLCPFVRMFDNYTVVAKKIGDKVNGTSPGYIGQSSLGHKWIIKYIENGFIQNVANCINEYISYPISSLLMSSANLRFLSVIYETGSLLSKPGVGVRLLETCKIDWRIKPAGLEDLIAIRFFIGDDDFGKENFIRQKNNDQIISIDHAKSFMSQPSSTPLQLESYLMYLIKRFFPYLKLDIAIVNLRFESILQIITQNYAQIERQVEDRVDFLQHALGNSILNGSYFRCRTKDGFTPVDREFANFKDYKIFIKTTFSHKINILPELIKILDERNMNVNGFKTVSVSQI